MPAGGRHTLATANARRAEDDDAPPPLVGGDYVVVTIRDNGPGFPEEVLAKKLSRPVSREEGARGAGIGLVLAATIVRTYGGTIEARNHDRGAEILLTLPLKQPIDDKNVTEANFLEPFDEVLPHVGVSGKQS